MKRSSLLLSLIVCGCAVGPDYKKPEVQVPETYRSDKTVEKKVNQEFVASEDWWTQFKDPELNALIEEGLANNRDLQVAISKVRQASGNLMTTRSQFFPQVGLANNAFRGIKQGAADDITTGNGSGPTNIDYLSAPLSWQIDIFGRIRRQVEASTAIQEAMVANREAVSLTVAGEIADAYILLRSLDRQLEVTEKTLASYKETLRIFELRYKYGTANQVQVSQVQSQVDQAKASIPPIRKAIAQQENEINFLLGKNPGTIKRGKTIEELAKVSVPPAGLPSTLLEQRPDIKMAEQQLIASNAEIGVAKAAYFPTIDLTAAIGTVSMPLVSMFSSAATVWSIGANAGMPLLTFGKIKGQVIGAEAGNDQALALYLKTVAGAFKDVDNSLIAVNENREEATERVKQVQTLKKYADLASMQFNYGYTDYLTVLNAEESLFGAEIKLAQVEASQATAAVKLYLSLGTGWKKTDDKALKNNPTIANGK